MAPDVDNRLAIVARQLEMAQILIDELEAKNLRLSQQFRHKSVAEVENEQLWLALCGVLCSCTSEAEKQIEILVDHANHTASCDYVEVRRNIKEAVK